MYSLEWSSEQSYVKPCFSDYLSPPIANRTETAVPILLQYHVCQQAENNLNRVNLGIAVSCIHKNLVFFLHHLHSLLCGFSKILILSLKLFKLLPVNKIIKAEVNATADF